MGFVCHLAPAWYPAGSKRQIRIRQTGRWADGQTDGHRSFNHLPMVGHLGSFQSFATVPNDKQPHLSASVDLANFHPRRTIATSRVGACLNLNA